MIPEEIKKAIRILLDAYRATGNRNFLRRAAKMGAKYLEA